MTAPVQWLSSLVLAAALVACAHPPAPPPPPPPPRPAPAGPPVQAIALPPEGTPGPPREVRTLFDGPTLKLATIALRGGALLPEHRSPAAVTLFAIRGAGTVLAGGARLRLDATHGVALAPNVAHAVEPDGDAELVLLVHHVRRGEESHP